MLQPVKKINLTRGNQKINVAVVVADFNETITRGLLHGSLRALRDSGLKKSSFTVYHVVGSFEVTQLAMRLAKTKRFKVIVCLGAIIKGETSHDQHLARAVTDGLLRVGLDTGVLVGLGVITTNNLKQARARSANDKYNRGYVAAAAVLSLIKLV